MKQPNRLKVTSHTIHLKRPIKLWVILITLVVAMLTMGCLLTRFLGGSSSIKEGKSFEPQKSVTIEGGEYHIPSMDIPEDVVVSFEDDVSLIVDGDVAITGDIEADCSNVTIEAGGAFNISGDFNNVCGEDGGTANLTLNLSPDDPLILGDGDSEMNIDGDFIINVGDVEDIVFTPPLPFEPADEPEPPVCSLSPDALTIEMNEDGFAYLDLQGECIDPNDDPIDEINLMVYDTYTDQETSADDNAQELLEMGETTLILDKPGLFTINLMAVDDNGNESSSTLITVFVVDFEAEEQDEYIAVSTDIPGLFYEEGDELELDSLIDTPIPEDELEYQWAFIRGDESIGISQEKTTTVELGEVGVMTFFLEVSTKDKQSFGFTRFSIYVIPEGKFTSGISGLAKPTADTEYDCANLPKPEDAVIYNFKAKTFKNAIWTINGRKPLIFASGSTLIAKDGVPAPGPKVGTGTVYGARGKNGGTIRIYHPHDDIVVCGGAKLITGSGADGQDAVATSKNGASATAFGGKGGKPGEIILKSASDKVIMEGKGAPGPVIIQLGKGGDGGDATATAGPGVTDCNNPTIGGRASAYGGQGGRAAYYGRFSRITFEGWGVGAIAVNTTLPGGGNNGGNGGNATATGGDGGDAANPGGGVCNSCIEGKRGGSAYAKGGKGGTSFIRMKKYPQVSIPAMRGGAGGDATANGGGGGDASNCPDADTGRAGGKGGNVHPTAGKGGKGDKAALNGAPGTVKGTGGKGGKGGSGKKAGGPGGAGGKADKGADDGAAGMPGGVISATPQPEETQAETEEAENGQGTPPVITAVEFPEGNIMDPVDNERIEIPADGTPVDGWIHFTDEEGDVNFAKFEPMEVDTHFNPFDFFIEEDFMDGDYFDGSFQFNLWCGTEDAQTNITLRVMLQDAAGNWSDPAILALYCD